MCTCISIFFLFCQEIYKMEGTAETAASSASTEVEEGADGGDAETDSTISVGSSSTRDSTLSPDVPHDWSLQLSDVGQFSYAAICAIALKDLYSDVHWHW